MEQRETLTIARNHAELGPMFVLAHCVLFSVHLCTDFVTMRTGFLLNYQLFGNVTLAYNKPTRGKSNLQGLNGKIQVTFQNVTPAVTAQIHNYPLDSSSGGIIIIMS